MQIKDKVAVITGGASGLGRATAELMAAQGAKVALWDMNQAEMEKVAGQIGAETIFSKVDVSDEQSVSQAVRQVVDAFGAIHIAVNCAGIGIPAKLLGKQSPCDMKTWTKVVQVNLFGTVNVMRLAGQQMAQNQCSADGERGVIVNTASAAAYDGQIGQTAYSASKAGLVGLTLPAAREFASLGIRVMTIAPGLFQTPMLMSLPEPVLKSLGQSVPFPSRLGYPAEYASLVGQIVENSMLNGETIRLDGAIRMAPK